MSETSLSVNKVTAYEPVPEGGLSWQDLAQNVGKTIAVTRHTLEGGTWLPVCRDDGDAESTTYRDPAAIIIGKLVDLLPPDNNFSHPRVKLSTGANRLTLPYSPQAVWIDRVFDSENDEPPKTIQHDDGALDVGLEAYVFTLATEADYRKQAKWLGNTAIESKQD